MQRLNKFKVSSSDKIWRVKAGLVGSLFLIGGMTFLNTFSSTEMTALATLLLFLLGLVWFSFKYLTEVWFSNSELTVGNFQVASARIEEIKFLRWPVGGFCRIGFFASNGKKNKKVHHGR